MIVLQLYRLYAAFCAGAVMWRIFSLPLWAATLTSLAVRIAWFVIEGRVIAYGVKKHFHQHAYSFKQQLGPYGIRLANMAENDPAVMKSLDEVFTPNEKQLQKNVDQLRLFDTLYNAGMRPDAQSFQIHDCKLKYGIWRLEQLSKKNNS